MSGAPIRSWRNHEREFRVYSDRFYKRSFRPDEFLTNIHGETVVPHQATARLENEAQCLQFILANTNIPVPKILEAYEENGSFILVTELIPGRDVNDLEPTEQALVTKEVESYVAVLRSLRSDRPGGPTGIMCPLPRILQHFPVGTVWVPKKSPESEYGFCHCDLGWSNIIIDNDSPRVRAIIDWEYAGYWPEFFELPYYHDPRPTGAQFTDAEECDWMTEFLASQL
jgi:aminoglycoside phosphotransferase